MAPEWITLQDVGRREVDPVIYDLLTDLARDGWRLRRHGPQVLLSSVRAEIPEAGSESTAPRATRPNWRGGRAGRPGIAQTGTTSMDDRPS